MSRGRCDRKREIKAVNISVEEFAGTGNIGQIHAILIQFL
jgi:hypothetical protein